MKVGYTGWMSSKYAMYGMDCQDWKEQAMWRTTTEKRSGLFQQLIRHMPYTFCNRIFGSDCSFSVKMPDCDISMTIIDGYSLFDWATILQNASAIHTVNTSIIYLLEMLDLKAPEVHLYQRSIPGQTFAGIDYLLTKHKYIFHG